MISRLTLKHSRRKHLVLLTKTMTLKLVMMAKVAIMTTLTILTMIIGELTEDRSIQNASILKPKRRP